MAIVIESFYDDQQELTYRGHFDLAAFFGRIPESDELRSLGWRFVHTLRSELPDAQPWVSYRVFEGKLTATSRRQKDVEATLARLEVLASLEQAGITI